MVKYLEYKNFNPNFPENHCVKYEKRRFKVKENDKWVVKYTIHITENKENGKETR